MLRKRTRSHQKDQSMNNQMPDSISESYFHSDILNQRHKISSFLKVNGLFLPKNSDSDSVRSPKSTLDFRIFSSFGNPFRCSSRSHNEGHSWDCNKVGLSIIDSLDDETDQSGKDARSSENKSIVFGRQMSVRSPILGSNARSLEKPKSLPKNVSVFPNALAKPKSDSDVVFEIGEASESFRARSMDSVRYGGSHLTNFGNRKSRLGSGNLIPESKSNSTPLESGPVEGSMMSENNIGGNLGSIPIPASEIELSEDYTCVITHGPNPKVTHIFGDCVLECHNDKLTDICVADNATGGDDVVASYPGDDFLKFCNFCKKKLDGEDIYMYRGEKAFCSYACRSEEIEMDEVEMD